MAHYQNNDGACQHLSDSALHHTHGMSTLAKRLKTERERHKLTQDQLAKRVGADKKQSLIANLEAGTYESSTYLPEIAHALGVDAYWLKTGFETIIAGDKRINEVVKLMQATAHDGRLVVLHKAREVAKEHPKDNSGETGRVISMKEWRQSSIQQPLFQNVDLDQ